MKKLLGSVLFLLLMLWSVVGNAAVGYVAYCDSDLLVVESGSGYTCAELYSGYVNEGDTILGEFNSYGMHEWYREGDGYEIRVYVDEYMCSEEEANQWVRKNEN